MPTALVTGASRGVGRGIAIALAESGFRVFATGRTIANANLPDTIACIQCDHQPDNDTAAAFAHVASGLDVLGNSARGGSEQMGENGKFTSGLPAWGQPPPPWARSRAPGGRAAFG